MAVVLLLAEAGAAHAGGWHAVAFMYHRFGEDRYPSTSVTLDQFEAHLDHLQEAGYEVWPLEKILRHVQSGDPVPDRTVAITIDDAYASVYEEAYPRLKERDLPFTVFVATDPVDQGLSGFMRWEQMREMQEHGATFANHSATHDYLVRRRDGESEQDYRRRLEADISKAQQRLEEELDADRIPMLFAYPYGEYNRIVAEVAEELGYAGVGQHSGAIGPYTDLRAVPRFPMAEAYAEISEFRQKAGARGLPVEELTPWDPVIGEENPPRMRIRLGESEARLGQLSCFVSRQGQVEVDWEDREAGVFSVKPPASLGVGRTRYNCTAPSPESGRFYWFSQQWIRLGES
ncbi:MAG: polysaccharide deacetylase family protein [Ectothiorhodospiraceae bacterium]|nr:polysaccharide deacetylase family protein [Ectothiorhodospiraceae bacterium]MCH8504678.1 polysaccharide deacetylase family protein [Ectothiorhodospiraceae bacterium]